VGLAAAATLAAALALFVWEPWSHSGTLDFVDGSQAVAAADAELVPLLVSDTRIELRQARGSVAYQVTSRPERLFVVRAGAVTVEVLGTAFVVNRHDGRVEVRVKRGRVRVSRGDHAVVLVDGEQVVLDDTLVPPPVDAVASAVQDEEPALAVSALAPVREAERPDASAPAPGAPSATASTVPSAAELFRAADDARASGDSQRAITLLQQLIREHPGDARVTMATFTIGRLYMQRGQAARAAQSFESCGMALGGEALAEAALARSAAGQGGQARTLARRYLDRFPEGARAKEMRRLAGE
jgi:transmembrane sensor